MKNKHPMQPLVFDDNGVVRFKENKIVNYLWRVGHLDMNQISIKHQQGIFSQEDLEQFYQLNGYSFSVFSELSLVSEKCLKKADKRYQKLMESGHKSY